MFVPNPIVDKSNENVKKTDSDDEVNISETENKYLKQSECLEEENNGIEESNRVLAASPLFCLYSSTINCLNNVFYKQTCIMLLLIMLKVH